MNEEIAQRFTFKFLLRFPNEIQLTKDLLLCKDIKCGTVEDNVTFQLNT